MSLVAIAGALSVALAIMGLYSVLAYLTSLRSREFGLRIALGEVPRDILLATLSRGVLLAIGGVFLGLLGAVAFGSILSGLLYGTDLGDPIAYAGPAIVTVAFAALASLVPALRASRVDPGVTLRE